MKTLVLATASAAALMMAGGAFAQAMDPPEPVSQIGTNSGMSANASSLIDQVGDASTANVTQYGNHVSSVVLQGGLPGAAVIKNGGGTANVTQNGNFSRSLIMQQNTFGPSNGETATVGQYGKNEYAYTYQTGGSDQATISQTSTNTAHGRGNVAGVDNRATQSGGLDNKNYAESLQGASLESWTTPDANYGASIVQDNHNGGTIAKINQDTGSVGDNAALIVMNGLDGSQGDIEQTGTTQNSSAAIRQGALADHSTAAINQYNASFDSASIEQVGTRYNASFATINQYGDVQTARVTQMGNNNTALTNQYASAANAFSRTTQGGENNVADVYQNASFDYSKVNQADDTSTATVNQFAMNDVSYVTQGTAGNAGSNNTADVRQSFANAWSSVSQMGNGNAVTVRQ